MATSRTKRFTAEVDIELYQEMVAIAERNGQPRRDVLEKSLAFYLHNVVPSQRLVRRKVLDAFGQSVTGHRDLLKRLAK